MPDSTPAPTVLERFFESFKPGDTLLILTHDHPDPDSISSAATLREIAQALGRVEATVGYGGIIGRAENAHMVKYLDLKLKAIDEIDVSQFSRIALVDTQPRTGNNSLPARRKADLVIDHHPIIKPTKSVPFAEIREGYGATATILAEYMEYFGLEVSPNLATALIYGIRSETQDLGRETFDVDIRQYMRLFPKANTRLLSNIVNSRVRLSYFRWLQSAISTAQVLGNVIVTRVGRVDNPDVIPEIADLLLRGEGIVWTFCQGEYNGSVHLSIRTTNVRKNAGNIMKRLLRNRGTGGGHGQIAGGKVDAKGLETWQIHELEDVLENQFLKLISKSELSRSLLVSDEGSKTDEKPRTLQVVK